MDGPSEGQDTRDKRPCERAFPREACRRGGRSRRPPRLSGFCSSGAVAAVENAGATRRSRRRALAAYNVRLKQLDRRSRRRLVGCQFG